MSVATDIVEASPVPNFGGQDSGLRDFEEGRGNYLHTYRRLLEWDTGWNADPSGGCPSAVALFPSIGLLKPCNLDLVHLQHRLHHAAGFRRVRVAQEFTQCRRDDLP